MKIANTNKGVEIILFPLEKINLRKEINQILDKVETIPGYSFFQTNFSENGFSDFIIL